MTTRIDQLWPHPNDELSDADLLEAYAYPDDQPCLRMNFISSIDGAATRSGVSGSLGDEADRRIFDLLRRPAHVVLVGAGTVRGEEYGAMRLDDSAVEWRTAHGLLPHPVFVLVSHRLDLDPDSPVFTEAPVRPIVYTAADSPVDRRSALEEVADVVAVGATAVDPQRVRADLIERGHTRIHSEGGPSLFGSFIAAGAVDELCLTIAPSLEAGDAPRIARSPAAAPTNMQLVSLLKSGSEMLARYAVLTPSSH